MIIINKYKYQDENDISTHKLMEHMNVNSNINRWNQDENRILELLFEMLDSNYSILDAGCGDGRLISKYESHFKRITAVERDPSRLKNAINLINNLNLSSKVSFQLGKIQDLKEDKKFDTIICSHVLQHISTADCEDVLKKFSEIIKPGGLLLILVSHSEAPRDVFIKVSHDKDKLIEKEITVEEFDYLAEVSKYLPVKRFTKESIQILIEKYDFQVLKCDVYHMVKKEKSYSRENPYKMVNTPKYIGVDLYLIAEKL